MSNFVPYIRNEKGLSEDILSALLHDRIIMLTGEITETTSLLISSELLYLEKADPDSEIQLYISSPGGSVSAGLAIVDLIKKISAPVVGIAAGTVASMASVILASCDRRCSFSHSTIMLHQPSAGFEGKASDIEIQARQIVKARETLIEILSDAMKTDKKAVEEAIKDDYWLTPEEAVKMHIIDEII